MNERYDATALFAIPALKPGVDESRGFMIYGRPSLFRDIRENHGVDVHVSRGKQAIDTDNNVVTTAFRPTYTEGDSKVAWDTLDSQTLSDYGVLRLNGSPLDTDHLVTGLNPMSLRRLGRDKNEMAGLVLEPLNLYRRSLYVGPGWTVQRPDDIAIADQLVLKPNGGFASRDVVAGTPEELIAHLRTPSTEARIIEERLQFGLPLPGIRGADEYQQSRLDKANELGVNQELRMYSYGDRQWMPVARVAEEGTIKLGGDEWVYVDEESIPQEAIDHVNNVKDLVDAEIGVSDTLLAVDLVYVTSESQPEPHWEVMEVNAEPFTLRPEVNGEVGLRHRQALATQIGRIARTSKGV